MELPSLIKKMRQCLYISARTSVLLVWWPDQLGDLPGFGLLWDIHAAAEA